MLKHYAFRFLTLVVLTHVHIASVHGPILGVSHHDTSASFQNRVLVDKPKVL
jgi:hypothetical protein